MNFDQSIRTQSVIYPSFFPLYLVVILGTEQSLLKQKKNHREVKAWSYQDLGSGLETSLRSWTYNVVTKGNSSGCKLTLGSLAFDS